MKPEALILTKLQLPEALDINYTFYIRVYFTIVNDGFSS